MRAPQPSDVPIPHSFGEAFEKQLYQLTDEQQHLQKLNGHPLDGRMRFDPEAHKYFFEDAPLQFSVTEVVSLVTEAFDKDWAIRLMKKGQRWPRAEYAFPDGTAWPDDRIKAFWELSGVHTRNRGTWMHYNIERHWNQLPPLERTAQPERGHCVASVPELSHFHQFCADVLAPAGVSPWRTEWRVCDPALSVAGSIDFVGRLADGSYCIVDWKRSQLKEVYGKKRLLAPLQHLEAGRKMEYYLQLNIYRRILQTVYGLRVSRMILGLFHPAHASYGALEVPVMDREAERLLEHAAALGAQNLRLVAQEEDRA